MDEHRELIQRVVEARRKHIAGHPSHKRDVAMWEEYRALRVAVPDAIEYDVAATLDDREQNRGGLTP